jgi:hypothetical protein
MGGRGVGLCRWGLWGVVLVGIALLCGAKKNQEPTVDKARWSEKTVIMDKQINISPADYVKFFWEDDDLYMDYLHRTGKAQASATFVSNEINEPSCHPLQAMWA